MQGGIAVGPTVAGILLATALTIFFSSAARSFVVGTNGEGRSIREAHLWLVMTMIWIVSVFSGALVAATASGSSKFKEGVVQGLMVWAASYLALGFLMAARAAGYQMILEMNNMTDFFALRNFFGELMGFGGGHFRGSRGFLVGAFSCFERH